jgi:hypothetical protein
MSLDAAAKAGSYLQIKFEAIILHSILAMILW